MSLRKSRKGRCATKAAQRKKENNKIRKKGACFGKQKVVSSWREEVHEEDEMSPEKIGATEETMRSHFGGGMGFNPGWGGWRSGWRSGSGCEGFSTTIKLSLVIPTFHSRAQGLESWLCFPFWLPVNTSKGSQQWLTSGSLPPMGEAQVESWPPDFSQSSPGCFRH